MNEKLIAIVLAVFCGFSGCFVGDWDFAFASPGAAHEHQMHGNQGQGLHLMETANVVVDLETRPAEIKTGLLTTVIFSIKDTEDKPLENLTITHERLVHVMIASEDFSIFAHIHPDDFAPITPEMKKTAQYPVKFVFPKAGRYLIAVDSAVKDVPFSEHFTLDVAGEPGMGHYRRDLARKKLFGEYEVTLSSEPERIIAGKEINLSYLIKKNGEAVTDLEPYLSAPMHIAIIQADLNNFIHTHGELPGSDGHGHHMAGHMHMTVPEKFGPGIDVHVMFPVKGLYQIFGEVKHHGKVIVTSFMVDVQ